MLEREGRKNAAFSSEDCERALFALISQQLNAFFSSICRRKLTASVIADFTMHYFATASLYLLIALDG